jgi:hypothetical protein
MIIELKNQTTAMTREKELKRQRKKSSEARKRSSEGMVSDCEKLVKKPSQNFVKTNRDGAQVQK